MTAVTADDELDRARPPAPRYDGKKVVKIFVAFLLIGTVVATAAAYFGHQVGAETRERFEAARAAH